VTDPPTGYLIELRVHGVSGTPPEALLGMPTELIGRFSGDGDAGFYRPRVALPFADADVDTVTDNFTGPETDPEFGEPPAGTDLGQAGSPWRRLLRAYSWGGLTSGRASRALWLLFLPFILVNLAHWMLPPVREGRNRSGAVAVALLRLLGLSLTLTLMLATAVAAMDVVGWQCGGMDYCGHRLGPASFLIDQDDGSRLAFGAVPVFALMLLLWLLGRESPREIGLPPEAAVPQDEVALAHGSFWRHDRSVDRLRACHVTAWTSGLGVLVLITAVRDAGTAAARAVSWAALVLNGLILAAVVLATMSNRATGRGGSGADKLSRPVYVLRAVAIVVLMASLLWVGFMPLVDDSPPGKLQGTLPGLGGMVVGLVAVQVVLLAGLFVAVKRCKYIDQCLPSGFTPSLRGYNAPFVATLAWLVGGGFSLGVGLLAARLPGAPVASRETAEWMINHRTSVGADAPLLVPQYYLWGAVAIVAVLGVAALGVAVLKWWTVPRRARQKAGDVLKDYRREWKIPEEERIKRRDGIATFRAWASLADSAPVIVAWFTGAAAVASAALLVVYVKLDRHPEIQAPTDESSSALAKFVDACVVITVGMMILLAVVAVQAFRDRRVRRMVAVLWDVVTFWPRANHPLTPPSYGERAVPELRGYITRTAHLEKAQVRVTVAAHSQGTVIAAAALLLAGAQSHVALMTFGSPLRRLYTQNFPAYFGGAALTTLRVNLSDRWINLWARTDPIGSWVFDDPDGELPTAPVRVDLRVLDVKRLGKWPDEGYSPICGHSGFWLRPAYEQAFRRLQKYMLPGEIAEVPTSQYAPPHTLA
jgi:hypothetical protein